MKRLGEMGDGDYSCVEHGMGMKEPCEHWKKTEAAQKPEGIWAQQLEAAEKRTEAAQGKIDKLREELAELELELKKRDKCSFIGPMRDCPTHGESSKLAALKASLVKVSKPTSYEERMNKFCRCVVPNESNVCANCHRPIYDERGN